MLRVPFKHVHKSLANINEKIVLLYQLFLNRNSTKKQKQLFSMSTLFVEIISILINASMYFNYDFDLSFLYKYTIRSWTGESIKIYDGMYAQKIKNDEVVSKCLTT